MQEQNPVHSVLEGLTAMELENLYSVLQDHTLMLEVIAALHVNQAFTVL